MASSLEQARALHEEVEALEKAAAASLGGKPRARRGALLAELQAAAYVHRAVAAQAQLRALYADADGSRGEELRASAGGAAALEAFYARLAAAHAAAAGSERGAGDADSAAAASVASCASAAAAVIDSLFTAEELFGRYVDMQAHFVEWCNLPEVKAARAAGATPPADGPLAALAGINYQTYLQRFVDAHASLPLRVRLTRQYRRYVAGAAGYLVGFLQRSRPLLDIEADVLGPVAAGFVRAWAAGARGVWGKGAPAGPAAADASPGEASSPASAGFDLEAVPSLEALTAALDAEGLKAALRARGLKSGGTPKERAERLWAVRGLARSQYPKKLLDPAAAAAAAAAPAGSSASEHAGSARPGPALEAAGSHSGSGLGSAPALAAPAPFLPAISLTDFAAAHVAPALAGASGADGSVSEHLSVAWLEEVAFRLREACEEAFGDTVRRLDRSQTKTYEERAAERAAEWEAATSGASGSANNTAGAAPGAAGMVDDDGEEEDSDEEGGGRIYNPKNVPLREDGTPMPLWLFKLQGLNVSYACEVCGGATYQGRRNFQRHFQEARHAHGMAALGIPNTRHFYNVPKIADVRELYAKVRAELEASAVSAEASEEFEDSMGNVMSRKTYEDLARQGLL